MPRSTKVAIAGTRLETAPAGAARPKARQGSRNEILDVALDMFSQLGFEGVSTGAIAKAAGVSQSVVIYHFETKEAMWRAAMERLFSRVSIASMIDQKAYKDLDVLSRLRVALRRFVHMSARHPQLGRVVLSEGTAGGPRLEWLSETYLRPTYAAYAQLFRDAVEAGELKAHDPFLMMLLAHSGAAMLFNLAPMTERLIGASPFAPEMVERQADLVVDALLEGLRVR